MLSMITWAGAVAGIRRWFKPAVIGILVGLAVWFAFQAQRLAAERDAMRTQVAASRREAQDAEKGLAAANAARAAAETVSAAATTRTTELEDAVQRQKGTIDAYEAKYGASRVSDLTRAHLDWLRQHQRR